MKKRPKKVQLKDGRRAAEPTKEERELGRWLLSGLGSDRPLKERK